MASVLAGTLTATVFRLERYSSMLAPSASTARRTFVRHYALQDLSCIAGDALGWGQSTDFRSCWVDGAKVVTKNPRSRLVGYLEGVVRAAGEDSFGCDGGSDGA